MQPFDQVEKCINIKLFSRLLTIHYADVDNMH